MQEFANFVTNQQIADDKVVVSFDVISLFTSIPVNYALEIVKRKLGESQEWQSATALSQDQVLDLLSFVLRNSYFSFQEVIYQQVFGCAMGSPVSAVIAELVMQEVEQKALATSIVQPRWWRRYVDDANVCLKKAAVQQFHDHLNSINQFRQGGHLPFLNFGPGVI